jgi:hypothetical protein
MLSMMVMRVMVVRMRNAHIPCRAGCGGSLRFGLVLAMEILGVRLIHVKRRILMSS